MVIISGPKVYFQARPETLTTFMAVDEIPELLQCKTVEVMFRIMEVISWFMEVISWIMEVI